MTDYSNGGSEYGMPGDQTQERSDRSPGNRVLRLGNRKKVLDIDPVTGKVREPEPEVVRHCSSDDPCCICDLGSTEARIKPGPHHNEACPLWELPDYGVFGPDE